MKTEKQVEMVHDLLQSVLRGDAPFSGWLDQDDVIVVNALGGWLIGAIDALWWILDQEQHADPDPDAAKDERTLKIPPGLGGFVQAVLKEAGSQGFELIADHNKKILEEEST